MTDEEQAQRRRAELCIRLQRLLDEYVDSLGPGCTAPVVGDWVLVVATDGIEGPQSGRFTWLAPPSAWWYRTMGLLTGALGMLQAGLAHHQPDD